ncbi:hypothetical protein K1719_018962 [Acacia pycnantha]|nr:hypothetical protein K1719_018962 [Acacia pycnantha]
MVKKHMICGPLVCRARLGGVVMSSAILVERNTGMASRGVVMSSAILVEQNTGMASRCVSVCFGMKTTLKTQ